MHSDLFALAVGFILIVVSSVYMAIYLKRDFIPVESDNSVNNIASCEAQNNQSNDIFNNDTTKKTNLFWSKLGFIWIAISLIGFTRAVTMNTSVHVDGIGYSSVNNLGLLQVQMMIYNSSIGAFVIGVVALATGAILKALSPQQ